jgi:polysaccharide export outer membrane protein
MITLCPTGAAWKVALTLVAISSGGCLHSRHHELTDSAPREFAKATLPEYVIEPPDILSIDALQLIPLPPYKVQSLDVLAIRVMKALPDEPIQGFYTVEPEGVVNLGPSYGKIKVVGMTLDQAKNEIQEKLMKILKESVVSLSIAQARGVQQIRGQHLVRPDGTISLGSYGKVNVTRMTIAQAKEAIETHLKQYLQTPEVIVDVLAYNSKVYYVVYDQGGAGQRIFRLPITGNETVLDAISQVSGLTAISDEHRIWVARPAVEDEEDAVMPVDWKAITKKGRTDTNYQLLPGDRVFVGAQPMIWMDTMLARFLSPFQRMMGFTLLGASTVTNLKFSNSTTTTTTTQ